MKKVRISILVFVATLFSSVAFSQGYLYLDGPSTVTVSQANEWTADPFAALDLPAEFGQYPPYTYTFDWYSTSPSYYTTSEVCNYYDCSALFVFTQPTPTNKTWNVGLSFDPWWGHYDTYMTVTVQQ